MSRKLTRDLLHRLREAASEESVEALQRQGQRRVTVLRYSEVENLVAAAVDEALAQLGRQTGPELLAGLGSDARARLLALLAERDALRSTVDRLTEQRDELAAHREVLRGELQRAESDLADQQRAGTRSPLDGELGELRARLLAELRALLADPALAARAEALVSASIDGYVARLAVRDRRQHDARLTQMRRRIERLRHKLAESEDLLERARVEAARAGPPVVGAPLEPRAPAEGQRRALLDEIFHLNLELRTMVGSAEEPKTPAAERSPDAT